MTIETAQMHMQKAMIVQNVKATEVSTTTETIEQTPLHNIEQINNQFSIEGHLQKWRAAL